jgi:hypothetical protein
VVRPPQPQPLGVLDVVRGHLPRQLLRPAPGGAGGVVDLVVDVGDVGHQGHVEPLVLQEALELGEDDERARVADVHAGVDRGTAGVDPDPARIARLQWPHLARPGVVEPNLSHGAGP